MPAAYRFPSGSLELVGHLVSPPGRSGSGVPGLVLAHHFHTGAGGAAAPAATEPEPAAPPPAPSTPARAARPPRPRRIRSWPSGSPPSSVGTSSPSRVEGRASP